MKSREETGAETSSGVVTIGGHGQEWAHAPGGEEPPDSISYLFSAIAHVCNLVHLHHEHHVRLTKKFLLLKIKWKP
jgi:hypothetical protein